MNEVILFLDGKKTYILAIVSAINSFLVASGVYTADLGALIQTILSILAGGTHAITVSAVDNKTPLGEEIITQRAKQ